MKLSEAQKRDALSLLKQLIERPSPYFEEKEIMEFTQQQCRERGLSPKMQHYFFSPLNFNGINLYGELGREPGPLLYLGGHLDTVQLSSGWSRDPYKASLEGNKLYGLGALDMKAGCAAIIVALQSFIKDYPDFKGKIFYHFASVEEGPYGLGSTFYLKDILKEKIDFAVITEPSSALSETEKPSLCVGSRGGYNYKIYLRGVSTHAATPHLGISALEEAAKLVPLLNHLETLEHPLLGKGASCVISLHSGSGACSVPDEAIIEVFRHVVPGESKESIEQEVEEILSQAKLRCSWELRFRDAPAEGFDGGFPPYALSPAHPYLQRLQKCMEEIYETPIELCSSEAIGDFNLFGGLRGIPTVLMGPMGESIHQPDECVYLDSYYKTIEIISAFLKDVFVSSPLHHSDEGDCCSNYIKL